MNLRYYSYVEDIADKSGSNEMYQCDVKGVRKELKIGINTLHSPQACTLQTQHLAVTQGGQDDAVAGRSL